MFKCRKAMYLFNGPDRPYFANKDNHYLMTITARMISNNSLIANFRDHF